MHLLNKKFLARNPARKGFALVLVLAFLVIITAVVLAFIVSVKSNLLLASGFQNGANAKILSDLAIQHAIGTLRQATCPATTSTGWASQPGMIRSFDASGNFTLYKLYTSDTPTVTGTSSLMFNPSLDYGLSVWSAEPELFTDLNSPVTNNGGNVVYPIVDPAASSLPVEGFSYTSPNTATGTGANPVPMPVKWIYVLQDGTLTTPTTGSSGTATWTGGGAPTASNPIVGRFAYWTDDETCKLNLNTASEGAFWERPYASTAQETLLANSAPITNEFQRYDGHPAKTSLDPVLGSVLPVSTPSIPTSNFATKIEPYYNIVPRIGYSTANLGGTIPQIQYTTSVGLDGDRLFNAPDELVFAQPSSSSQTFSPPLTASTTLTTDFLRKTKFFLTTDSRSSDLNLFGKPRVCLWPLQQNTSDQNATDKLIAFCSTVGSPSASGNAYYFQRGTPWLDNNPTQTFNDPASAASGAPVYTPQNPMSSWSTSAPAPGGSTAAAIGDWAISRNQALYTYLQDLTCQNIPGYPSNTAFTPGKYTATNRDQILTEMVDYIRSGLNLFSDAVTPYYAYGFIHNPEDPGYCQVTPLLPPGSPAFPAGTAPGGPTVKTISPGTPGAPGSLSPNGPAVAGVIPTTTNSVGTKGFGRFPTITEATLVFYNSSADPLPGGNNIRAMLLFKMFNPVAGFPGLHPDFIVKVIGLDKITMKIDQTGTSATLCPLTGLNLASAKGPRMQVYGYTQNAGDKNCEAGFIGLPLIFGTPWHSQTYNTPRLDWYIGNPTSQGNAVQNNLIFYPTPDNGYNYYPFISAPLAIGSGTTFSTTASPTTNPVQFVIYDPNLNFVQTINVSFPALTNQTIPTYTSGATPSTNARLSAGSNLGNGPPNACIGPDVYTNNPIILNGDIVESMVAGSGQAGDPSKGDLRAVAALINVPTNFFSLVPNGGHELRSGSINAGVGGKLVAGANYNGLAGYTSASGGYPTYPTTGPSSTAGRQPSVSPEINGTSNASGNPGDWDNGIGYLEDGPYINFPEQGNIYGQYTNLTGNPTVSVYFDTLFQNQQFGWVYLSTAAQSYHPNRQAPSAVMFGSLPTGIDPANPTAVKPWQTLLFSPNPAAGFDSSHHNGFANPPDHLFLDLFTMPIVQPYALSEPTSTQGRVNLNFNIMPFNYITRSTGMYGVLSSVMLTAIPSSDAATYKAFNASGSTASSSTYRYNLDLAKTVSGFTSKFNGTDYTQNFFRSASEVCTMSLVPTGYSLSDVQAGGSFWSSKGDLTGDNAREAPYNDIYPRVTTKSNSYTVYYRVQVLKQTTADAAAGKWVENYDQVQSESRGSALIDRYVDPADPRLLPYTGSGTAAFAETYFGATTYNSNGSVAETGTLEPLHKFRVVSSASFAP